MPKHTWNTCITLLLFAATALAQDLAWRIPALGALEYRRTWKAAAGPLVKSPAEARASEPKEKAPERYLPRLVPAPILCQSELRADQLAIGDPVRDLRDVLRAVAFDFAGRTAVRMRFPRVLPLGDLAITGPWTPLAANGAQSLRAALQGKPPAALPGEQNGTAAKLRPFCVESAEGTLTVQRVVDASAGRVVSFTANLDVVVEEQPRQFRRLVLDDDWQFVAERDNQDADFRKRVAQAIRLGTGFVRSAIDSRRTFLVDDGKENRSYGSGRLALGLLTLLHGHVPNDDPVVVRGFDELAKREIVDTYSLGTALMAMAARHAPEGEAERIRSGQMAAIGARPIDESARQLAAKWAAQLRKNVDPRIAADKVLRFNYVPGPRYDTSLQQYGLLGLWSAHVCGVEVPGVTFAAAARHLLAVQGVSIGRVPLRLASYADLRAVYGTGEEPRSPELRAEARGFAYVEKLEPAFGSMTSAGISGLLLARAGMQAKGLRDPELEKSIDEAVRDGYGWLAHEFTVRANPGFAERADHHWYYWLYGLERSCELDGIARLHGRDWYYEGAMQLLAMQQGNGSFRTEFASSLLIEATCFAILFLAKATPAVPITGR
jgi:hypothetical protein